MIFRIAFGILLSILSLVLRLPRFLGGLIPIERFFFWIFDWVIGVEFAREFRDRFAEELQDNLVQYAAENTEGIERPVTAAQFGMTKDDILERVQTARLQTERRFTNGESVVGLLIAAAGFSAQPFLTAALTFLLFTSVGFRIATVEILSFDDVADDEETERLLLMHAWNGGLLSRENIGFHLYLARIFHEWDPEYLSAYFELVPRVITEPDYSNLDFAKDMRERATEIRKRRELRPHRK